ncbi:ABC transporter ATP-binding protein [Cellulomonas sp. ATA003]|uniref:ABC transporter ATP-binding protein n=1 Tax=Cellulomonas sp. ATA003 TaxID=3073064 RepID=UPI002873E36C|nr:ABC transporter ATP-binding protein [Cellulomonas sp. ATA003]WNB85894.1 ABC transporter ATP-binding protein [Cellulomonas sp. ATA003]
MPSSDRPVTPPRRDGGAPVVSTVSTFRRLGPFVRPVLPRLVAGMLCALGASLAALAVPQVLEHLVDGTLLDAQSGDRSGLWAAVGAVLALGVLEAGLIFARRAFILVPGTHVEARLRRTLFAHLQDLPVGFHDHWPGGQLLSRAMSDLGLLRRWLSYGIVMLVVNTTTILVGAALMISLGGPLGLVYLLGAVPVVVLSFRFSRRYRVISRLSQDQAGDLATTVEESVHGIRVLKAFGRGNHALSGFAEQAGTLRDTELRKARTLSTISFALSTIPEVVLGVCLFWGIFRVTQGQLDVGALAAFFATASVVNSPVEQVGQLLSMTLTAKTAVDRHFEVVDTVNDVADPARPVELPRDADGRPTARGALTFSDVRFRHDGAAGPGGVLDGVDLEIRAGETMALVGLTGAGKTTMAMLVPRLYDVTAGSVRIDGVDVRDMTRGDLRSLVAVAFEDATLFSDTVRANVLLGAPPSARTDADLERALAVAQAQFVHDLPHGVDTQIGEEGLALSGGQRQRLAVARAIAARPRVLVLDDPLSALDVSTEELVTAALRREVEGTTALVVAHRPSTVALADRVAVLQEGRISAVGTHSELVATHEHYRYVISSLAESEQMAQVRV